MTKNELVKSVAGKIEGMTQKQAGEFVEVVISTITEGLVSYGEVNLSGFLKLTVVDTPAKTARNPKTNEPVEVPAGKKVKVKVLKNLKDTVAGK